MPFARLVGATIQLERLFHALSVGEEVCERVRQTEMRRKLRAVIGAAEYPQLGTGGSERMRRDHVKRVSSIEWRAGDPRLQLVHLLREILCIVRIRVERERRALVRAGRAPHDRDRSARRNRFEHAKLLGHLERRVMRQHHARAADADALRGRGDRGHENLGRGADDVVRCCGARRPSSGDNRARRSAARARAFREWRRPRVCLGSGRLIEYGELHGCPIVRCGPTAARDAQHD